MKKASAKLYEIKICGGTMDYIHGNFQTIQEIYLPDFKAAFNRPNGNEWHCFETDESRYKEADFIVDLDIPKNIVSKIKQYIKAKKELDKEVKNIPIK